MYKLYFPNRQELDHAAAVAAKFSLPLAQVLRAGLRSMTKMLEGGNAQAALATMAGLIELDSKVMRPPVGPKPLPVATLLARKNTLSDDSETSRRIRASLPKMSAGWTIAGPGMLLDEHGEPQPYNPDFDWVRFERVGS